MTILLVKLENLRIFLFISVLNSLVRLDDHIFRYVILFISSSKLRIIRCEIQLLYLLHFEFLHHNNIFKDKPNKSNFNKNNKNIIYCVICNTNICFDDIRY